MNGLAILGNYRKLDTMLFTEINTTTTEEISNVHVPQSSYGYILFYLRVP